MANAANIVKLKRSAVAGKSPLTSDLQLGELALNTYDGRLFFTATQNSGSTYNLVTLTENSLINGSNNVTLNSDGTVSFPNYTFPAADGIYGQVLISDGMGNLSWQTTGATSSGTVTAVSIVSANGFSGTVATANTTPAITIQTTVTGLLKGNGTSVSAATSGTDYLAPGSLSVTTNSPGTESLSYSNGIFTFTPAAPGTGTGYLVGSESPTINNAVFGETLTIGTQTFYTHPNGFSVNEDFDITDPSQDPANQANFTGYHFASGTGRAGTAFTLARSDYFTDGFGITGDASNNNFVIGSETANTDFVFKTGIGMPFDVSGGTPIFTINRDGSLTFADTSVQTYAYTDTRATALLSVTINSPGNESLSYTNGVFTFTPADLSSYATQSYVTGQGYITNSVAALTSLTSIGSNGVDTTANGNLIVSGNLTVNGTTETINSTTVSVTDKNIELGKVATPTDTTANGGGITLKGATDKTINWVLSTTAWTSSENFDLASGKTYKINGTDVLSSTTLGANIVNSSLTSVGTLTNLTVTNIITGSITGNAGTVTNGVYTTGSYADPTWLTSLAYSKLTGAPTNVSSFNNDANYATQTYVTTAIANATSPSVRYDINNQNLTSTQQSNARINIGLDDATLYFYCYMFG
jgi:hypothetical protein